MEMFKRLSLKVVSAGSLPAAVIALISAMSVGAQAFTGASAPEIDPGAIVGAMTMLVGGAMLLTNKYVRN